MQAATATGGDKNPAVVERIDRFGQAVSRREASRVPRSWNTLQRRHCQNASANSKRSWERRYFDATFVELNSYRLGKYCHVAHEAFSKRWNARATSRSSTGRGRSIRSPSPKRSTTTNIYCAHDET